MSLTSLWQSVIPYLIKTQSQFQSVQSVPITTKIVSSNPAHGEVYLIQHHVTKFVSD
jgi:hypothetical protein